MVAVLANLAVAAAAFALRGPTDSPDTRTTSPTDTGSPSSPAPSSTLPAGVSIIATASVGTVPVFDNPGSAEPSRTFENPWFVNGDPKAAVPLVFHVETQGPDGWVQVLLPVRPNGSTGWIKTSDVRLTPTPYRISIGLGDHHLTVYKGTEVVLDDTVAVGAGGTPTPTGKFYIRALLQAPNPHTAYGPFAYGLSGYSETLQEFAGGDAEVGIHGNNDTSVLGTDVSHGCVRMSNDGITMLTKILPLGTPVEIVP
jgi:lipoprotein-anchoring transpeptidase ErfK/SrfK